MFKKFVFAASLIAGTSPLMADWLPTGGGHYGSDPIYSGTVQGFVIYVCRVNFGDQTLAGKIVQGQGCTIPYAGKEVASSRYDVLQTSSAYQWRDRNDVDTTASMVYVGKDKFGGEQYVCRTRDGVAGRLTGGLFSACQWGWGNREHYAVDYDVLVKL